ncbi:hypothetical protein LHP98_18300 [Rhodobacter sp. Har01]|uniref:hypothetical protein n=1 Tax=Rhodobacter sp. Har01 TaxID=2883999 RepID=UPI001D0832AF|nr:hypothetical protein [Rhodobacter sp. Har01]MCB6180074.1 hypothetical protein [Rhodobacter sp. Har01]
MNRLILALSLLFVGTLPLHAETPDCLPHPTQDCVFQMALRQADDEDWTWLIAEGYLAVAYLQELEQTGQDAETLAALLVKLSLADPDPMAMRKAIKAGWSGLMLGGTLIDESPALTEWFVLTMADLNRQAGLPVEAPPDFMPPEQLHAIRTKVAAISADVLPRYARLTEARGSDVPRVTVGFVDLLDDLAPDHQMILAALFAKGALTGAWKEISSWTDAKHRTSGFAALALAFAMAGELTKAIEVLQMPELANSADLDVLVSFIIVEVWARAGDGSKAQMLPESIVESGDSFHLEASVIAALATGDADTAWRLVSMIKPNQRTYSLDVAVDAALVHGPEPVEALLALMPPEEQAEVLYALGKAQIRVGDVEGTTSTIDRLGRVPDHLHYGRILQYELAPVLAALGRDVEAVQMAIEIGSARTTALVAAWLE